ncbi:hypothetical protein RRF57_009032 [Xylaria bambusicola]|uniref:Uncharacterized protein n=1 Tax=Xylaria bambusicola TaxID=326684 RepID=A0AAN7UUA3_9PEZI
MNLPPAIHRGLRNRRRVYLSGRSQGSGSTTAISSENSAPRPLTQSGRAPSHQGGGQPIAQTISPTALTDAQTVMTGVGNPSGVPSHSVGFYEQQQPALPGHSSQPSGGGQLNTSGSSFAVSERRASTQNQPQPDVASLEPGYILGLGEPILIRRSALPESVIYADALRRLGGQRFVRPYPDHWPTMQGIRAGNGYYIELRIQIREGLHIASRLTVIERGSRLGYGDQMNIDIVWGQDNQGQLDTQQRRGSMPLTGWEMTCMFNNYTKLQRNILIYDHESVPQNQAFLNQGTPASGPSHQSNQGHISGGWSPGISQPLPFYSGNSVLDNCESKQFGLCSFLDNKS